MAFIPGGGEILNALRWLVKWLNLRSCMRVGERHRGIEAVDCLRVGDTERREARSAIGAQLSEIHIERAILLQHKEDVLDHVRGQSIDSDSYRLRDRSATRGRICGVRRSCSRSHRGGALRRGARIAHGIARGVGDRECGRRTSTDLPSEGRALTLRNRGGRSRETQRQRNRDRQRLWSGIASGARRGDRIRGGCAHRNCGGTRGGQRARIVSDGKSWGDGNRCGVAGRPRQRSGLSGVDIGWARTEFRNLRRRIGGDLNGGSLRRTGAARPGCSRRISCRLRRRILRGTGKLRAIHDIASGISGGRSDGHRGGIGCLPGQRDTLAAGDRSGTRRKSDGGSNFWFGAST